ncbi:MAG: tetratricopeptide repeat protein, partial [Phycisphaerales bacterium]|nr:tetratricopeptide repeat protein [Phycisphaerales bacterium]
MARTRSLAARQELVRAYQFFESGDYGSAVEAFRAIHTRRPRDAEAVYMLGVCELQSGFVTEARAHIEAAITLTPNAARYYYDLGMCHRTLGDFDAALAAFERMLLLSPGHEWGLAGRAEVFRLQGRYEEAWQTLAPLLEKGFSEIHAAVVFADVAIHLGRLEEGLAVVSPFTRDEGIPIGRRVLACFRMGDILRRLDRHDEAFAAYQLANHQVVERFDPNQFAAGVTSMLGGFTPERIAELQQAGDPGFEPVFIVGMPRSGTTLVEQILDAHPDVHACGELDDVLLFVNALQPGAPNRTPLLTET